MHARTMMGAIAAITLAVLGWPGTAKAAGKCWPEYPPSYTSIDNACNPNYTCTAWASSCTDLHRPDAAHCAECACDQVCQTHNMRFLVCARANPIVFNVCYIDPYCCKTAWDDYCVWEATTYYGAGCF
jgi:hypothetical protein